MSRISKPQSAVACLDAKAGEFALIGRALPQAGLNAQAESPLTRQRVSSTNKDSNPGEGADRPSKNPHKKSQFSTSPLNRSADVTTLRVNNEMGPTTVWSFRETSAIGPIAGRTTSSFTADTDSGRPVSKEAANLRPDSAAELHLFIVEAPMIRVPYVIEA
jgi:hypothetical protein